MVLGMGWLVKMELESLVRKHVFVVLESIGIEKCLLLQLRAARSSDACFGEQYYSGITSECEDITYRAVGGIRTGTDYPQGAVERRCGPGKDYQRSSRYVD